MPTSSASQEAIGALAKVIFEEMERLAPSAGPADWSEVEQWERDLHTRGVARMLADRELVLRALGLSRDDDVDGTS